MELKKYKKLQIQTTFCVFKFWAGMLRYLLPRGYTLFHIKVSLALFYEWFNFETVCQQKKICDAVVADN